MSSVSSKSSSSGQDESVRKAREEYRKKEAELIKKHNKEIRALNDKYVSEIDTKDRKHAATLGEARKKSQDSLTQRDMRYRKEMEELRAMHSKQLEKLMEDNRQKLAADNKAARLEVKQANLGKNDRTQELHDRYARQHAEESQKFSEKLEELRQDQKETLTRTREKLNESHDKEIESLRDNSNETISKLKNEYRQLRQGTTEKIRGQEIRHMQDKARMQSSHMDNIKGQAESHNTIQKVSREAYQDGIKDVRHRMAQAREQDLENQSMTRQQFQADVEGRIDSQVNRLERDLAKARNANAMRQAQQKRDLNRQMQNMQDSYQEKYNYLENARKETLRQSNEINAQNVREIRGEADKQMATTGRYYMDRMEVENFKNRQAIDNLEKDFALRQGYTAEKAEERINRIRSGANVNEQKLRENFQANIDVMKQASDEEKREVRMAITKDKNTALQMMKEQAQKQEIEHQRKVTDIISKYEKRISDMNDQIMREKRLRDQREKTLISNLRKQHQNEIDALKLQQEDQNKQAKVAHEREMRDTSRRNQEKLDEVLRAVKKSQA